MIKFLETWYIKYFFSPILFAIPIAFLNAVITKKELLKELPGGAFLEKYQIILIAIFVSYLVISKLIYSFLLEYSKPDSCVTSKEILAIVEAIDNVVASKNERFLEAARKALREKWKPAKIFREITKPEQQIALLVYAVQGVFEFIYNQEVEIKVGLMEIKNNKPKEWFAFAPKDLPPRTGPDTLSAPTSAIMRALDAGDLIIVQNMQKEINKKNKADRMCVKGSSLNNNGSLITIPIYCPNTREAIYVLSIKANKENTFSVKEIDRYKWILQNLFFKRIILEHHLMLMKEEATK